MVSPTANSYDATVGPGVTEHDSGPAGDRRFATSGPLAFWLTCGAYLATTTAEAMLSPIYPTVDDELGFGLSDAGLFFAVLAAAIAVATVIGGSLLHRWRPSRVATVALAVTTVGSLVAAAADSRAGFLASQIIIGSGAGLLWPAAVKLVGDLIDPGRRGLSMGVFGVAFSGGLVTAAGLAALGASIDWRLAFVVSAALAAAAMVAMLFVASEAPVAGGRLLSGVGPALGLPTAVGVVAGFSQYATVSFLPVFAVEVWAVPAAGAALVLAAARVLSIPVKLVAGWLADRSGPELTVRILGLALAVSGLAWATLPLRWLAVCGAVAFAALVSGLFPLANLMALDRSGGRGVALGVFRAVQIGAGAAVGLVLGAAADRYGLRPTIAVTAVLPVALVLVGVSPPVRAG